MGLKETITSDVKEALKAGRQSEVGLLRLLLAAVQSREIEMKSKEGLDEDEVIKTIAKEAKKRKEAIALYLEGGREDLKKKEEEELVIIEKYLPKQLDDSELEQIVRSAIEKADAKTFPDAMKAAMPSVAGKADGKRVSEIVKNVLERSSD